MYITKEPRRYRIGCFNWTDFIADCSAEFDIWHSGDCLHIHYYVDEPAVVARCGVDMEHVWEDSCVEFFFDPLCDGTYYNVESNCIGRLYLCHGTSRSGRIPVSSEALESIHRESSLGNEPFGISNNRTKWDLRLDIPSSVFSLDTFSGLKARGNFYKCADASPVRHYMSLYPIHTPKPDFHRPEFFDDLIFE